jgi:hypothetical protein
MNQMRTGISAIILGLASFACAKQPILTEIGLDSLKSFSNVRISTTSALASEDSLFCGKPEWNKKAQSEITKGKSITIFSCGEAEVSEFTFFGFQGEYARFLFKPEGSQSELFGKVKIRKGEIRTVYLIEENGAPRGKLSEKQFNRVSGIAVAGSLAIVALISLLYVFSDAVLGLIP